MDWGLGHYERTALQLLPAAQVAIDRATVSDGERLVDIGCGTGNAALLAAERGARVTGVDPAPRLLEVARERATAMGVDASFAPGEGADLPLNDGEADIALSVFGVIFAPDVRAAAQEMARVTGAGGRIVLTAWIPGGAISDSTRIAREATARAMGVPPGPPPFAWHDGDALTRLFGPLGFDDTVLTEERLAFTAPSAADYLDAEMKGHPLALAAQAILGPRGETQAVRDRMLAALESGNEEAGGFRVTSRYVVAIIGRR